MNQDSTTPVVDAPEEKGNPPETRRARREAAIRLLRSWREGGEPDEQEQRETWTYLKKALDENRLSYRKESGLWQLKFLSKNNWLVKSKALLKNISQTCFNLFACSVKVWR